MEKLEIYIHIPFCLSKCGYCDFLSFAASETEKNAYIKTLINEIKSFPAKNSYQISTIFIGGGTPTVLSSDALKMLLSEIYESFSVSEDAEISIECNPKTADAAKFKDLRKAGVNRLSIGVQVFDDRLLKILGRIHTKQEAIDTILAAKEAGFENINTDLMFSLPGQSLGDWEESLKTAISLGITHISAYSLILEEDTPFFKRYGEAYSKKISGRTQTQLPSEEEEIQMYELAVSFLQDKGFYRYEISNFAKQGFACRHNDGYWTRIPYAGFGLGAASFLDECRFTNTRNMEEYLKNPTDIRQKKRECCMQKISRAEAMSETMILGLRRSRGVSISGFKEKFGVDIFDIYGKIIEKHVKSGFLKTEGDDIYFTPAGILISNICLSDFV